MLSQIEREKEGKLLLKQITGILGIKNPGIIKRASITIETNEPIIVELTSQV